MTYCFQAELVFSNAARRDAVLADMQQRIGNKPRWGAERLEAGVSKSGQPAIFCELRFESRADQEDIWARITAFAVGARTPEPGSTMTLHDCTHDETVTACDFSQTRTW